MCIHIWTWILLRSNSKHTTSHLNIRISKDSRETNKDKMLLYFLFFFENFWLKYFIYFYRYLLPFNNFYNRPLIRIYLYKFSQIIETLNNFNLILLRNIVEIENFFFFSHAFFFSCFSCLKIHQDYEILNLSSPPLPLSNDYRSAKDWQTVDSCSLGAANMAAEKSIDERCGELNLIPRRRDSVSPHGTWPRDRRPWTCRFTIEHNTSTRGLFLRARAHHRRYRSADPRMTGESAPNSRRAVKTRGWFDAMRRARGDRPYREFLM